MPEASNNNSNGLVPPQLPKSDEVDKDIGMKYLDTYQSYISAHSRLHDGTDKKKRNSVSSNSDVSVAPSMSASHRGQAIPAIVRVDSRESCLSYTPPNLPSEFSGLIVNDRNNGPGFCYLGLVKPEYKDTIKDQMGRYPTFRELLEMNRHLFLDDHLLSRLQISNVAPGHYHVVTGTIMPNVTSTLAAIVEKSGLVSTDENTLCYWACRITAREGLSMNAPDLDNVLGSNHTTPHRRYQDPYTGLPGSGYTYPPQYIYPPQHSIPSYYISSRYMYPHGSSPPYINYEYREPRSTRTRYDYTTGSPRSRVPMVEPRHDRSYHHVSDRSARLHSRSVSDQYNRRDGYSDYDDDLDRTLRVSAREHRRSRPSSSHHTYNFDDIRNTLDTISQEMSPSRQSTRTSQISSAASTSSIKVYGSLQGATCNICTDVIEEGAGVLSCGHVFHSECVDKWLSEHNTCPQCRAQQ